MQVQEIAQEDAQYQPTTEQAQRAAALRKFNLLYVYLPIGLLSAIVVATVVFLLIVALNPPSARALLLLSGLADVTLILAMLPVVIIGAALLAMIAYGYSQGRKAGMAPIRQTQRLMWRMDNLVGRLKQQTEATSSAVRQPFLSLNGAVTYVRVLIAQLVKIVKRS